MSVNLHVLGVNGPFPESGGATSGYLLEAGDTLIQLDLGSGVLSRLTARTAPESLTALLLSHWHFDHAADLPVLMYRLEALGFNAGGRQLQIYAPADESSMLRKIASAAGCFRLTDIAPGDTLSLGSCTVRIGEARHPVPAVGFRIECGSRVFSYTGDTNTLPSLASFYRGTHLLLADGLFPKESWAETKPHLSAALAASIASDAGAEQLVLTHLNPFIPTDILLREARSFHPNVSLAEPGKILAI